MAGRQESRDVTPSTSRTDRAPSASARLADRFTRFSGSFAFVVIHAVWFPVWIAFNLLSPDPFDEYPFGLLTMIVSLEAIFLSTFVLISQNRTSERDTQREIEDYRTNLRSETLIRAIADRVGVDGDETERRIKRHLIEARFDEPSEPDA